MVGYESGIKQIGGVLPAPLSGSKILRFAVWLGI